MNEATKQAKMVNGVNVTGLFETINAVTENAEIAKFNFRASNRWISGGNSRTTVDDYSGALQEFTRETPMVMWSDEPPVLLGNDKGPNPVEYALAGLAGCITTGLVYHAAAQGVEITEVESTYSGNVDLRGFLGLDPSVRNGFQNLEVIVKVKGNATEEKLQELVQIAQDRSPVFDIFTNKVPVSVRMAS